MNQNRDYRKNFRKDDLLKQWLVVLSDADLSKQSKLPMKKVERSTLVGFGNFRG